MFCPSVTILKSLTIFEQRVLYLHFTPRSANYVAGLGLNRKCTWPTDTNVLPSYYFLPPAAETVGCPGSGGSAKEDAWAPPQPPPWTLIVKGGAILLHLPEAAQEGPTLSCACMCTHAHTHTRTLPLQDPLWWFISQPGEDSAFFRVLSCPARFRKLCSISLEKDEDESAVCPRPRLPEV